MVVTTDVKSLIDSELKIKHIWFYINWQQITDFSNLANEHL